MKTFKQLVRLAESNATSDLAYEVRGLLLFAEENATLEEIIDFMSWLGEDQDLFFSISTANSQPVDHFQCANGRTWEEMKEMYLSKICK